MRILGLTCDACGAAYNVAESATIEGDASEFSCAICGSDRVRAKIYRELIDEAERRLLREGQSRRAS